MVARYRKDFGSALPGIGIMMDAGPNVPSDGAAGYAPGCLFFETDTAGVAARYLNIGTFAAADFNIVDGGLDLSGLTASASELNALAAGAVVSSGIVDATAATLAVTEALHNRKTILLDRAAGIAVTLPVAAPGLEFEFIVKTTFTGAASIKSVAGTDIMIGHAIMGNDTDNTVVNWPAVAADTFDTIDLLGTANSTGGMAGQRIRITGLAALLWYVEIVGDAAGTEASPFSNAVA